MSTLGVLTTYDEHQTPLNMSQYNLKRSLTTAITGDATSQVFGFTKQVVLAGGVVAGTNLG